MNYWFTSDFHLGHANIIKYCNRPFKNLKEMNETIINRHNERVKPRDTVYFIGDYCFRNSPGGKKGEGELLKAEEYKEKLNGNFVFVRGNHDRRNSLNTNILRVIIEMGKKKMNLVHDPKYANWKYPINLVGHIHQHWKTKTLINPNNPKQKTLLINVGVDVWNFYPVSWREIDTLYTQWKKKN